MASFEQNKNSKLWSVRYRVVDAHAECHKRKSGFKTKREAQEWYYENYGKDTVTRSNLTLQKLVEEYLAEVKPNMKYSTYCAIERRLDLHCLPYFDKLKDITPTTLTRWQNVLTKKGFSYHYKTAVRSTLYSILQYSTRYGFTNPLKEVKSFKRLEKRKEMLYWDEKEFAQFIGTVDDITYKSLFAFLYLMGCRKGEALALEWKDIDLEQGIVRFYKSVTKVSENGLYDITTPKTENSTRDVTIPKNLIALLKEHREGHAGQFVWGGDRPLPFTTLLNRHRAYTKKAGVKQIRIHDLRHSCVSYLINHGQNEIATIYVIAQRIGDSVEQIYKTYGHLFPDHHEKVLLQLENISI